jgi:ribonuclease III
MSEALEELEQRIGYCFSSRELLRRALTHKSLSADTLGASLTPRDDNEQFEFLGDAVLGFLSSDHLYRLFPSFPEGKLSRLKSHIVSASHLYEAARVLGLGTYLRLGRGEEKNGGRTKKALLANAVEALIAAIYLDGGLEPCRAFLEAHVFRGLALHELGGEPLPLDAKSALQELAQARGLAVPRYAIVREQGPEHAKLFTVEARVGREFSAQADGASKKAASQKAAGLLLQVLADLPDERQKSQRSAIQA